MKIQIVKRDDEYAVQFSQGCQHFTLDYRGSRKECAWMKKQLQIAFDKFRQTVEIVNTLCQTK